MTSNDWLAARFEENRTRLRAVALRMLGSTTEADDAVQESWLRLSRTDVSGVENLSGWLTTVVSRVCLDALRSRQYRREEALDAHVDDTVAGTDPELDPEHEAVLADSVGLALLVVLETLAPAERLAFVLHDLFAVPYEEIAPIVGRSPTAARQLASRARRRVQEADPPEGDLPRRRAVVEAFLGASRKGDFAALLTLLDPEVVLRADEAAIKVGAEAFVVGARAVADTFSGRAQVARLALIDGAPGAVWYTGGRLRVVFRFTVTGDRVTGIELLSDPDLLGRLEIETLPAT